MPQQRGVDNFLYRVINIASRLSIEISADVNHLDNRKGYIGVAEQILQPDKRDNTDLGTVEQIGVYQNRADLIKNNERQQKRESIYRPAGALEVRTTREIEQLTCAVLAIILCL